MSWKGSISRMSDECLITLETVVSFCYDCQAVMRKFTLALQSQHDLPKRIMARDHHPERLGWQQHRDYQPKEQRVQSKLGDCRVDEVGKANTAGAVLKLVDVCQPGSFILKPCCGEEDLNRCTIGIKYNGSLTDPRRRPLLIDLLLDLREHFPDAMILAKDEYDRWNFNVREDINQLRRELSDYL